MPRVILDLHALNRQVYTMLDAYDIPVENFVDELLASNDSLIGTAEERRPVLETILANHSPSEPTEFELEQGEEYEGDGYDRFEADTALLDDALEGWRFQIEQVRQQFNMDQHHEVVMNRVAMVPHGVVVDIQLADEP